MIFNIRVNHDQLFKIQYNFFIIYQKIMSYWLTFHFASFLLVNFLHIYLYCNHLNDHIIFI